MIYLSGFVFAFLAVFFGFMPFYPAQAAHTGRCTAADRAAAPAYRGTPCCGSFQAAAGASCGGKHDRDGGGSAFLNAFSAKIALLGTEEESAAQGKLEDTEPVVCAGLGISTQENRDKLNELAAPLRAQQVTAYRHNLWRGADRRAAACR